MKLYQHNLFSAFPVRLRHIICRWPTENTVYCETCWMYSCTAMQAELLGTETHTNWLSHHPKYDSTQHTYTGTGTHTNRHTHKDTHTHTHTGTHTQTGTRTRKDTCRQAPHTHADTHTYTPHNEKIYSSDVRRVYWDGPL